MRLIGARDDRVDLVTADGLHRIGDGVDRAAGVRHIAGALGRGVADDLEDGAGRIIGEDSRVIRAHHAGADEGDSDCHARSQLIAGPDRLARSDMRRSQTGESLGGGAGRRPGGARQNYLAMQVSAVPGVQTSRPV